MSTRAGTTSELPLTPGEACVISPYGPKTWYFNLIRLLKQNTADWVSYKQQKYISLLVLQAGESESKVSADLVSGEEALPGSLTAVCSL